MVTLSAILEFSQCLFRVKHFSIVVYTNYACKQKELFFFFLEKSALKPKKGKKLNAFNGKIKILCQILIFLKTNKRKYLLYTSNFLHTNIKQIDDIYK